MKKLKHTARRADKPPSNNPKRTIKPSHTKDLEQIFTERYKQLSKEFLKYFFEKI